MKKGQAVITKSVKTQDGWQPEEVLNVEIGEDKKEDPASAGTEPEPMARVVLKVGITRATKPYEGYRLDVGVEFPCEVGEVNDVYDFAKNWVDEKLGALVEEMEASGG